MLRLIIAALAAALLGGCATLPRAAPPALALQESRPPVTILISIDGLGANRLGQGVTPRLDALAAAGVSGSMRPSFPSNTFPNHITLVTGLRPDKHGIVDQKMRDPARPGVTFRNSDPLTNRDPFWWDAVDPIWLQAERAGIRTGMMHWVGSDVAIRGQRPSWWWPFDSAITSLQRVETVLDWVRRPIASRPAFMTLYFDVVDQRSHNQGYGSPQEQDAIREVDGQIGRLVDTLAALHQPANLVIVSDHGMAPVPPEHIRPRSLVVDPAIMESITEGPLLDIYPLPGKEAEVAARLADPPPHLSCWARKDIPARFKFGTHPRSPPFLCLADTGWSFPENPKTYIKGEHGYDPDDARIAALFIAAGPAFHTGLRLDRFDNVHVYPMLARLIGVTPHSNDGDMRTLGAILRADSN
ncbi:alkaline phosphatase family protein [Sphingobium boeckii]|uniref:Putative AlkP superfamily pyrophosphatase or phosphodiesterase n=1 Tax=Sphingobium boeckii TaxID=1082345 RepID=A0A7W9EGF0_9SPHN|nr:ectonucleotide pyrophosphatase/phosphodiesterase [Sphingobium boeckii]MBB5687050.1 putative AlkP superfamily pyrophosphatase or phosphodiesterase [Sphingobium boeckii]